MKSEFSISQEVTRTQWHSNNEFLLSSIGFSFGFGNIWRFPYVAYKNGGGAFLIPYIICLFLAGKSMFLFELYMGQYSGSGPYSAYRGIPAFRGIGLSQLMMSFTMSIYYCVIMSYIVFYMAVSCQIYLPWKECNINLPDYEKCNKSLNEVLPKDEPYFYPSEQYWIYSVLNKNPELIPFGVPQWHLILCLFFTWGCVFLCLYKGITSGRVVYVTTTLPYVLLLIILMRSFLLDGALVGVKYFFLPQWRRLLEFKVWQAAASQMFFSLNIAFGGLMTYASYNPFSYNIYKYALIVSWLSISSSLLGSIAIFSVLGNMDTILCSDVSKIDTAALGLIFVMYPSVISQLPLSPFWSLLFFLMLFTLGLSTQFGLVECVLNGFHEKFPLLQLPKWKIMLAYCGLGFFLGIIFTTKSGIYLIEIFDKQAIDFPVLLVGFLEIFAMTHFYGLKNIINDFVYMLGSPPKWYWKIMWAYITPILLIVIFLAAFLGKGPISLGTQVISPIGQLIGWLLTSIMLIWIPLFIIIHAKQVDEPTLKMKLKNAFLTNLNWIREEEYSGRLKLEIEISERDEN